MYIEQRWRRRRRKKPSNWNFDASMWCARRYANQHNDRTKLIECDLSAVGCGARAYETKAMEKKIQRKRMLRWLPGIDRTNTRKKNYRLNFISFPSRRLERYFDWIVFSVWINYHNFPKTKLFAATVKNVYRCEKFRAFFPFSMPNMYFLTVNHIPFRLK